MMDADQYIKRFGQLKSKRSTYEQDWRDCFDLTFPVRGNGFSGEVVDSADVGYDARQFPLVRLGCGQ